MKLLMITRKVDRNEHLAGFIYHWVEKIAEQVDELKVIAWQEGDVSGLPENVSVTQLKTSQSKFLKIAAFKMAVWKNLKDVDGVFCHQMPIYTIFAAPLAKLRGKKVVSWYTHKQVDKQVKLMEKLTDVIVTASKESFRLPSKKVVVTGHGIDPERFGYAARQARETFDIISIGRVSPTKDYESMIKALDILSDKEVKDVTLTIVGAPGLPEHETYMVSLKKMIEAMQLGERVQFAGPRTHTEVPGLLQQSDLFINMSGTGSVDKAVLEAMSTGCLVLTSNEAFAEMLPPECKTQKDQPVNLAEAIKNLRDMSVEDRNELGQKLRQEVEAHHNLDLLVKKIVSQFN